MGIIDLQETTPNNWRAKYRGNYGVYTIKVVTDGTKTKDFSCSCPSDYYPCKHIPMVEDEIKKRIATVEQTSPKEGNISIESVLKNVSPNELCNFITRLAKYNQELANAIFLEFAHKTNTNRVTNYSDIIRAALKKLHFDYEDLYDYHEDCIEIDILDQWLEKARQYADKENFNESILICKACIEEYADWLLAIESDIQDYIDEEYQYAPFEILAGIISKSEVFSKELYDYCKTEMPKTKYKKTEIYRAFNDLMAQLAPTVDPENFIELQDKLLNAIADKKSDEAKQVIQRKIDFYKNTGQPEKVWELITNNIQIESFRKELTEKKIAENKLNEAKELIMDVLSTDNDYYQHTWNVLLLTIAQKEKDIPSIRKISFSFIGNHFKSEYYKIYKSTYTGEEWLLEVENIIRHYQKNNRFFSSSIAEILLAEKQTEQLMNYVEKYLSVEILDKYHAHFPSPEKTLALFRRSIDEYVKNNTGRTYYEYAAKLFNKMNKIKGGKAVVNEMILQYKLLYKNRRAMMEILNRLRL